jgi:coniferyl-aldehyde dehydrogenase
MGEIDDDTVAYHFHEPLGVVGQIIPWNFPLLMAAWKLAPAIAAGNCVVIKPAEQTPATLLVWAELIGHLLPPGVVNIVNGFGLEAGKPLASSSRIAKIAFTGETSTGRLIMQYATENIIPVTLELGGKSPTVVCDDFDLEAAAARIVFGKFVNAGQTCVGPDYLFLPEGKVAEFAGHCRDIMARRYAGLDDPAYTSIADEKSFRRLLDWLEDAREKGASVSKLLAGPDHEAAHRKIAPMLVTGVNEDMVLMQEEIFGPFLPVMTYRSIDEVLDYINERERPLALYLFTRDKALQDRVIKNTLSGGVCLNDCVLHAAQHDMPFGGIGNSGMGQYHGPEGFNELSKLRPVFRQALHPATALLHPPYGKVWNFVYRLMMRFDI